MNSLIIFFPIALLVAIYLALCILHAGCIKLSGRILHVVVSWKHSFILALAITLLLEIWSTTVATGGKSAPLIVVLPFGFVLSLVLGGWFLGSRVITLQGEPLGWIGGSNLSGLAFVILALAELAFSQVASLIAP